MTEPATGVIYALVDPRNAVVRYVGQTTKSLEKRLAGHLASPAPRVGMWLDELDGLGLSPGIVPLQAAVPVDGLLAEEKREIARRIIDGEDLLNSATTAEARSARYQRMLDEEAERVRQAWERVSGAVREALGGPLPPGQLPAIPISARANHWYGKARAVADEVPVPRSPGDDTYLSKETRLDIAEAEASDVLWRETRNAWVSLNSMARDRFESCLEAWVGRAVTKVWQRPSDLGRYLALIPWALVAVSPWAAVARRAGMTSEQDFESWVSEDSEVRESLAFLASHDAGVLNKLHVPEEGDRRTRPSVALVMHAAAHCGFALPEAIAQDAVLVLQEYAKDRQLSKPMADMLLQLEPRVLDRVFGPNLAQQVDADLGLSEGTAAAVLSAVLKDRRSPNLGKLGDIVVRAGQVLPTVSAPNYRRWHGDTVPILQAIAANCVSASVMPPPDDWTADDFVTETRSLWRLDDRFTRP